MQRDRRRRDLERTKRRAKKLYPMVPKNIKYANHLAVCSGPCCGNPRRWFGEKTIQEKRADEAYRKAS